jgi:hypothetical protein
MAVSAINLQCYGYIFYAHDLELILQPFYVLFPEEITFISPLSLEKLMKPIFLNL